jgi:hypothetical protein
MEDRVGRGIEVGKPWILEEVDRGSRGGNLAFYGL